MITLLNQTSNLLNFKLLITGPIEDNVYTFYNFQMSSYYFKSCSNYCGNLLSSHCMILPTEWLNPMLLDSLKAD